MNDGYCFECGEEFHLDDTGGYNPPCECKICQGAVCRSCHPWEENLPPYDDDDAVGAEPPEGAPQ